MTTITQDELLAELRHRFGDDPMDWAFVCPSCKDVATGSDFKQALADHPRTHKDGSKVMASDVLGQECIGRTLGVLDRPKTKEMEDSRNWGGRGCNWVAYGLFRGPVIVTTADGKEFGAFEMAPAKAEEGEKTDA